MSPTRCCAGSTGSCRAKRNDASGIVDRLFHDRFGRGVCAAVPARPCRAARPLAAKRLVRVCRAGDRLHPRRRGSRLLRVPSRPARTSLARLLAMALLLAVARRRHVGLDLRAGGRLRHRMGLLRRDLGRGRVVRFSRGDLRRRDDRLHRHDLCVAQADPPMAQSLGRAELFRARILSCGSGSHGRHGRRC